MRLCPCGWLGAFAATGRNCRCTPEAVARYQGRLSGPLLDRIDMHVDVPSVPPAQLMDAADGEPSAAVAERVAAARARQQARQGGPNSTISAGELDAACRLEPEAARFMQAVAARLGWSGRSLHRVMKLARTIADLAGADTVGVGAVAEAVQYRRALPEH